MACEDLAFRSDIRNQVNQASRSHQLLEHVCDVLENEPAEETLGAKAQRLRGAAVVARQAADELLITVGWLEASESAERHGLTDTSR